MNVNRARELMNDAIDLLSRKNRDYGSKNIDETGVYGIGVRLLDKVHRILNLTKDSSYDANFESVEDTFLDIMNYGLIGKMLSEGTWGEPSEDGVIATPVPVGKCMPMVYLAGPIDAATMEQRRDWREEAAVSLSARGVSTFDPSAAFRVAIYPYGDSSRYPVSAIIRAINRVAIVNSGAILVNLPLGARPFGTIREIEFARATKKLVVVAGREVQQHLDAYDLIVTDSMEDAIDYIVEEVL